MTAAQPSATPEPADASAVPQAVPGAPFGLTVSELHVALDEALRSAGLGQVKVTGVVHSLRRKPRYCSFELVEYHPDAQRVKAVLPVSVFGAEAAAALVARAEAVATAQEAEAAGQAHRAELALVQARSRRRLLLAGIAIAVLAVLVVLLLTLGGR